MEYGMNDPIADSQTEAVIAKLRRGEGTDALRDEVSAALLSSMSKLIGEVAEIKENIWKSSDLRKAIDERHAAACANCPARKMADEQSRQKSNIVSHLVSPTVMIFVIAVLSLLTAIYATIGRHGFDAVTDTVKPFVAN